MKPSELKMMAIFWLYQHWPSIAATSILVGCIWLAMFAVADSVPQQFVAAR